ncbi:PREDICTED: uncharacterized protein LOC108360738 [Rhagoletis zephyria]|uniref:uncharacterized protein LOC108360738 n=1 Tax=Rhagoletis zephyria TaxID=28612 RepID=UPI0008119B1A|nr:PREDICTED: uncharacterized protein LOC108360738 [Rhagoletis zephyria]
MTKFILGLALCGFLVLVAAAHPLLEEEGYNNDAANRLVDVQGWIEELQPVALLVRHARSPDSREDSSQENKRGRVELKYEDTPERGREATFKYNHNLAKSDDGSYSVDAYAQGKRNYDWNQNDFQGGLEGHWHFKG